MRQPAERHPHGYSRQGTGRAGCHRDRLRPQYRPRGGGRALVCLADVTDAGAVAAMAAAALARFGRIDILINNAAVRDERAIDKMTTADWGAAMAVILEGRFHFVEACLPALKQSGAGSIVNIGGLSAHTGSKHRAHVIAAKAGLVGLTDALGDDP